MTNLMRIYAIHKQSQRKVWVIAEGTYATEGGKYVVRDATGAVVETYDPDEFTMGRSGIAGEGTD